MAATLTQAQTIRTDATFQGRVRVAMGVTARNILADNQQAAPLRHLSYQIILRPNDYITQFLDYVASRTDLLNATEATTIDANIQSACDAALALMATSL